MFTNILFVRNGIWKVEIKWKYKQMKKYKCQNISQIVDNIHIRHMHIIYSLTNVTSWHIQYFNIFARNSSFAELRHTSTIFSVRAGTATTRRHWVINVHSNGSFTHTTRQNAEINAKITIMLYPTVTGHTLRRSKVIH